MPELLAEAEEVTLLEAPLTEDLEPLEPRAEARLLTPSLHDLARESLERVYAAHAERAARVVAFQGAEFLYRADFRLLAFRVIEIGFRGLGGRFGWFFGARDTFFFPQTPLSLEALGVVVFLPPLVVAGGVSLFTFAWGLVN